MSWTVNFSGTDNRFLFVLIVVCMLVIAVGHLFIIEGLTSLVLGLPLWLWLQLGLLGILFVIAWIATEFVSPVEWR